jgi:signal transduction histidine kinase
VAALVDSGALPQPMPVAGTPIVQVVDGQNRVRAASPSADALVPLLRRDELTRARLGEHLELPGDRAGVTGPMRVVAVTAGPAADPLTVVVAMPVGQARQSVAVLRNTLFVAYPLLVGGISVLAWRVVGATLRPVEELRAGAEAITGGGRSGRLPVPDGADEIRRLAVTLNDMLNRQDAARARQRAFVADAAHELRSPLANMRVQLEVAQQLAAPPDSGDLLADVDRLTKLVDDLLLLARSDDAPKAAGTERVDLVALAREVAGRYDNARVPVGVGPALHSPQWTVGDPAGLTRAVANLVDNAVRHAKSRVTLSVSRDGSQVLLSVTDDGPGIPTEERDRVFDRFTRLDEGRARDAGGAGLGLAIVRELVHRHGGTVRLADASTGEDAGPGVRAEIRLPG